jgi:hypothetical protein
MHPAAFLPSLDSRSSPVEDEDAQERRKSRDRALRAKQREQRLVFQQQQRIVNGSVERLKQQRREHELRTASAQYACIGQGLPATTPGGGFDAALPPPGDDASSSQGGAGVGDLISVYTSNSSALASKGSNSLDIHRATDDGNSTVLTAVTADRTQFVSMPVEGLECYLCKTRQAGCPLCWDFPVWVEKEEKPRESPENRKGEDGEEERGNTESLLRGTPNILQPLDYAFTPGCEDVGRPLLVPNKTTGGELIRPPLHTPLTTETAIRLWRGIFRTYTTLFVKTVPSGEIVTLVMDAEHSTVSELYDTFRANSCDGDSPSVHLCKDYLCSSCTSPATNMHRSQMNSQNAHTRQTLQLSFTDLPTDKGIYSICNQDEQETELLNANINAFEPLSKFSIGVRPDAAAAGRVAERAAREADREAKQRALAGRPAAGTKNRSAVGFSAQKVSEELHGPYAKHPPVPILYYPWYSTIEASDAWHRRPKPSMRTVKRYLEGLFDSSEPGPDTNICKPTLTRCFFLSFFLSFF